MANFAELDGTNTVVQVTAVHNDVTTVDGVEDEQRGIDFLNDLFPDSGTWVQTSYNNNQRHQYAGVGFTYDAAQDVFVISQPFPSWTLDENFDWQPPVAYPSGYEPPSHHWDEDTTSWVEITP
jgi:hypothetical protein